MNGEELDRAFQVIRATLWSEVYASSMCNCKDHWQSSRDADTAVASFEERRAANMFKGK